MISDERTCEARTWSRGGETMPLPELYVVGFAFTEKGVVLIRKNRPEWQAGRPPLLSAAPGGSGRAATCSGGRSSR